MKEVYLIDGNRTPFIRALGVLNPWSASDLAVASLQSLFSKIPIDINNVGEVITGCVAPSADEANIGRIIALRSGCKDSVTGWTVQRNCASGLQAIDCGVKDILNGRHDFVIAGGTEAMSRAPLLFKSAMVKWLINLNKSKTLATKAKTALDFRPHFLAPVISLLKGLTDPLVNMSMGQTAEKLAYLFDITRSEMDEFALKSHEKAILAQSNGMLDSELSPLVSFNGQSILSDNGVRKDSSLERLAKLKPVFDRPYGMVTAGNSSQLTDGAAFVLLASGDAVAKHGLKPIAKVLDFAWSGLDPTIMGLGPAYAIRDLLLKNKMSVNDIDFWEINEAFAAQVISCTRTLSDSAKCKEYLGTDEIAGKIKEECLNVDGGAIALGHPVGASGARITLHLARVLERNNAKLGVASLCIGGGQGGAVLIERVEG